jgi:hypothetical protein
MTTLQMPFMLHRNHPNHRSALFSSMATGLFLVVLVGAVLCSCASLRKFANPRYSVAMRFESYGFDGKGGTGWNKSTLLVTNPSQFSLSGLRTKSVNLWIGTSDGRSWTWDGTQDPHGTETIGVDLQELEAKGIVKIRRGRNPPEEIRIKLR